MPQSAFLVYYITFHYIPSWCVPRSAFLVYYITFHYIPSWCVPRSAFLVYYITFHYIPSWCVPRSAFLVYYITFHYIPSWCVPQSAFLVYYITFHYIPSWCMPRCAFLVYYITFHYIPSWWVPRSAFLVYYITFHYIPSWWVPRSAFFVLFSLFIIVFQFVFTSSNSADSRGNCRRISSPKKMFCMNKIEVFLIAHTLQWAAQIFGWFAIASKINSIWRLGDTWSCIIITIVSNWWWPNNALRYRLNDVSRHHLNDVSRHHPQFTGWCLQASSGIKAFWLTSRYIHWRWTVSNVSTTSRIWDKVLSQRSTSCSNALTNRDAFMVASFTWLSSNAWNTSSVDLR